MRNKTIKVCVGVGQCVCVYCVYCVYIISISKLQSPDCLLKKESGAHAVV